MKRRKSRTSYRQWRSCLRKRWYWTVEAAAQSAKEAEQRTGDPMTIYPCMYGMHWHVAHKRKEKH